MDTNWTLPILSTLALAAVLWSMHSSSPLRPRRPRVVDTNQGTDQNTDQTEYFEAAMPPPPPAPTKPRPGTHPDTPVDAVFQQVIDVSIPVPKASMFTGDTVPYTEAEVKDILANVLARVNDRSALDLRLVALDGVRKVADADKTLYYTLTAAVYSPPGNVGLKIQAAVVVPRSNVMYVSDLRTFNAAFPDDAVRGSRGPEDEAGHADWVPVL